MGETPSAYDVLRVVATADQEVVVAAYRALARLRHPDRNRDPGAQRAMAELNAAYARVRSVEERARYDHELRARATATVTGAHHSEQPVPAPEVPQRMPSDTTPVIDFGRYAGFSLKQVARIDADYLRWLRRHSAGLRFRGQIDALLGSASAA